MTLPSVPDGEPLDLRSGRGPRILLFTHATDCDGCDRYLRDLVASAGRLAEWGARLIVVLPEPVIGPATVPASAVYPVRIVADPERAIAAPLGLAGAAVVVTDEWGEIFFAADAAEEHELPAAEELVEWVRFIAIQCPECEQPEGEWRTLR